MSNLNKPIRNLPAFVKSYLSSRSGQNALRKGALHERHNGGTSMALAFQRALG